MILPHPRDKGTLSLPLSSQDLDDLHYLHYALKAAYLTFVKISCKLSGLQDSFLNSKNSIEENP